MSTTRKDIVAGIDILPGYSIRSSNRQPHYALVLVDLDGNIIDSYEDVSFARLLRLVWEHKPSIMAIDNVFELAENVDELRKIVDMLPPQTKLVQVTGWGPEAVNVKTIARKIGLEVHGKLSPLRTAYLSALIASRGEGVVVKLLEEKTKIIVTRGRSVGHGGMSYDRYRRSIRAGILNVTKTVKKILDQNGFDYDLVFRKSNGGLEKSIFTVYAPRDKLYGLIKPFKNKSVRLIVKPVYTNKVSFENAGAEKPRKGLIIGIDPGISTGIAVIDLDGTPLFLHSSKNFDRGEILNIVSSMGEAVIVATDVSHPPELVKKTASILNAQLYLPPRDMANDEKHDLINKLLKKYPWLDIQDTHERDALAAAYKAYLSISEKIKQALLKIEDIDLYINKENIKINIVRGKSIAEAIEEEIEKLLNKKNRSNQITKDKTLENQNTVEDHSRKIKKLINEIKRLRAYIARLENKLKEKDRLIEDLVLELKYVKKSTINNDENSRKINLLIYENKNLRKKLEEMEEKLVETRRKYIELSKLLEEIIRDKEIAVPHIPNLSYNSVRKIINTSKTKNTNHSIIYVDEIMPLDNDTIQILRKYKVAILTEKDYGQLYVDLKVPVIKVKDAKFYDKYAFIKKDVLSLVEKQWREIEEIIAEEQYERVIKLVAEYQEKRKKSSE
ncbi:DUF460 domain-containing protein [Staphylothermus hellenicus]|uniref:DUF460 domain-containing protein n=1 Tax=Staphylothermus hellenicus (strain DSM 12710 / JCM 10830 / BK20S6-10-b1 / P8) TaxID=591019 RepID=D7D908_STAHD|nr:DUF460 domain-containing protein [Staphylothermus hellenicus]ADI32254.1 Protein of unknown function DUF460 [Staphylothermus hellenicus DSM 12710]